jgi:energy-coupling factor transport system permease protein
VCGLALIAAAVILPALIAHVLPTLVRLTTVLALPLVVSVLIVNVFFFPGGTTVLFSVGPITATAEGLGFALLVATRVVAISGALTLFYLTTRTSELVVDLEHRGVSPRLTFVARSAVDAVPAMVARATTITAAQRARGLDTEANVWRRLRGVVPIVGPTVLGAIGEVEERTLALEARAFARPGRRTLLWTPADGPAQRIARWLMTIGIVALVALQVAGSAPC